MDNKLRELSRQVAWTWNAYGMQHVTTEADESAELILDGVDVNPLYSQEYVSALLAELEASKQYAKERDAENESLALTVGRLRVELHNEGAANAHAYERIRELEKRLATPVRLPTTSGRLGVAYTRVIPEVIEAIRAAGFKCVGDEQ